MKVKITKTIDMHQIPTEARKMLDQAKNNLAYGLPEKMNQAVMYSLSSRGEEFFLTIDAIDNFRKDLASLDESLQEVQNILVGYKEALISENAEQDAEQKAYDEQGQYEKEMSRMDRAEEGFYEEG
tara:strand:- start:1 stop:378 length:378 start_codon:yes stop_codon:yes gene_type:complete